MEAVLTDLCSSSDRICVLHTRFWKIKMFDRKLFYNDSYICSTC
jgi:hypothetical protein